jgi:hypothetical protein
MMLTLKLISMATCYQDASTKAAFEVSLSYVQQQQQQYEQQ